MTILESLRQGVSNYPVPMFTLERVALARGLDLNVEATVDILLSKCYRLSEADVKIFVSTAPNVSQSGISFDLLVSTRDAIKKQANAVYKEYNDSMYEHEELKKTKFGYKGDRL